MKLDNLIHVGKMRMSKGEFLFLFLRKKEAEFSWSFADSQFNERKSDCFGSTISEAIQKGRKTWPEMRLLHCGFRYMLPVRDFVGVNAFFFQMVASYQSPNAQYFDEEVGYFCFVDNASKEALDLMRQLR